MPTEIITRKGWVLALSQTDEHPTYGTAYALVKGYTRARDGARQDTTNLEIVIRRPGSYTELIYVFADNGGYSYPAGVPIHVFNIDPTALGYQIDGKPGPSSVGWRLDGTLEVSANLRIFKEGVERQAWVAIVLRQGEGGAWYEA